MLFIPPAYWEASRKGCGCHRIYCTHLLMLLMTFVVDLLSLISSSRCMANCLDFANAADGICRRSVATITPPSRLGHNCLDLVDAANCICRRSVVTNFSIYALSNCLDLLVLRHDISHLDHRSVAPNPAIAASKPRASANFKRASACRICGKGGRSFHRSNAHSLAPAAVSAGSLTSAAACAGTTAAGST